MVLPKFVIVDQMCHQQKQCLRLDKYLLAELQLPRGLRQKIFQTYGILPRFTAQHVGRHEYRDGGRRLGFNKCEQI